MAAEGSSAGTLTRDMLVERARALRPRLYEQQDTSDRLGRVSDELQQAFTDAGFFRIMTPKMFGGLELEPRVFLEVVMEIARGHPASAWCFTLAGSHAYFLASHWPEQAQRELFGPDGDFRAAHVVGPAGTMTPADGGYVVSGVWPFASGIPISNHFIGGTLRPTEGGPPRPVFFVVPREQLEILPDWGEDRFMGMRASGSNSVRIEDAFVPAHHVVDQHMMLSQISPEGSVGSKLHDNPMYLGVAVGWFHCEFAAIFSGTARAALDEFEKLIGERDILGQPGVKRVHDPFVQNLYGLSLGLAESARALTLSAIELYQEQCRRAVRDSQPITAAETFEVWGMAREACQMACTCVERLFHAAGASAGRKDNRLQRYFRDIEMYRLHIQNQPILPTARGRAALGLPPDVLGA
ncbi:MAG TPA: acyl-CoA dehydrogenase family protein [Caulobacteraceae bacterium]